MSRSTVQMFGKSEEFRLLPNGRPEVVSGVPPDLFTKDGQLWGNPVFDWQAMEADGFAWWIERVRRLTELVDVGANRPFSGPRGRLGLCQPGDATARGGRWERAPGFDLFSAIEAALGHLPIVVEDLGIITPRRRLSSAEGRASGYERAAVCLRRQS